MLEAFVNEYYDEVDDSFLDCQAQLQAWVPDKCPEVRQSSLRTYAMGV